MFCKAAGFVNVFSSLFQHRDVLGAIERAHLFKHITLLVFRERLSRLD